MILNAPYSIKEIADQGRSLPWPAPKRCPVCGHRRLWGHGFVLAYFDGARQGIWLRRWRCPICGGVHRMRPAGFYRRFQATVERIRDCLSKRLATGFWPPGLSRSRQGHWLRSLGRRVAGFLGVNFLDRLLEGFDLLGGRGLIPVTRSI